MWKDYVWNPATCNCENGKYLASIMDDSTIICDNDEKIRTVSSSFNEKKVACKTQSFYILLAFLLINYYSLLIAVSIYCNLIKYQAKILLPFHDANNKLNKFLY